MGCAYCRKSACMGCCPCVWGTTSRRLHDIPKNVRTGLVGSVLGGTGAGVACSEGGGGLMVLSSSVATFGVGFWRRWGSICVEQVAQGGLLEVGGTLEWQGLGSANGSWKRLAEDRLGARCTLGRRARMRHVGTQAAGSAGEGRAWTTRGSKTGVVGVCVDGPRVVDRVPCQEL